MRTPRRPSLYFSASSGLFAFVLILWMSSRFTVLYDYSFVVNTSWRWQQGLTPYIDQIVALPPATFAIVATLFTIFGVNSTVFAVIGAANAGASSFLLSEIYYKTVNEPRKGLATFAVRIVSVGVFGVLNTQIVLQFPFYDCFAATCILYLVYKIVSFEHPGRRSSLFAIGVVASMPLFFKLNVGAFSILGTCIWLFSEMYIVKRIAKSDRLHVACAFFSGLLMLPFIFLLWLLSEQAFRSFIMYAISGPTSTKSVFSLEQVQFNITSSSGLIVFIATMIGLSRMPATAKGNLLVSITYAIMSTPLFMGLLILVFPNIWNPLDLVPEISPTWIDIWPVSVLLGPLLLFFSSKKIDNGDKHRYVVVLLSLTLIGFHMSQGFEGSSYATAPIVMSLFFLVSQSRMNISKRVELRKLSALITVIFPALFAAWMLQYGLSGNRLAYADILPIKENVIVGGETNRFIALKSDDATAFGELINELEKYKGRTVLELPMEDPMPFLIEEHIPWGLCAQADNNTCPQIDRMSIQMTEEPPSVVIIKTKTQLANQGLEFWSQQMILRVENCYVQKSVIGSNYVIWESAIDTKKCLQAFNE
jgi:hypothetical protein